MSNFFVLAGDSHMVAFDDGRFPHLVCFAEE